MRELFGYSCVITNFCVFLYLIELLSRTHLLSKSTFLGGDTIYLVYFFLFVGLIITGLLYFFIPKEDAIKVIYNINLFVSVLMICFFTYLVCYGIIIDKGKYHESEASVSNLWTHNIIIGLVPRATALKPA